MKLFTFYSESHEQMFQEYLLPTVGAFEVKALQVPQECITGVYHTEGWISVVRRKIAMLLDAARVEHEPFVYSDADVICRDFTPEDVLRDLGTDNFAAMHNGGNEACSGFMFIRPCSETIVLLESTLAGMDVCDEPTMNAALKALPIKSRILPESVYTNYGLIGAPDWTLTGPARLVNLPETVKVFHANYVIGLEAKEEILAAAKAMMEQQALVISPAKA